MDVSRLGARVTEYTWTPRSAAYCHEGQRLRMNEKSVP